MGRGWKRATPVSTAPVPYPTTVLQGDQAVTPHQDLHRHERERREDSDLDGTDYDAATAPVASEISVAVEFLESGGSAAAADLRLSRPLEMVEPASLAAAGTRRRSASDRVAGLKASRFGQQASADYKSPSHRRVKTPEIFGNPGQQTVHPTAVFTPTTSVSCR